jgi:hypothetical protein
MKEVLGKLRFPLYGFIVFGISIYVTAGSPRTSTRYLDIINGRSKVVSSLFGVVVSDRVSDTEVSKLVTKYKLQGPEEWVRVSHNGSGLFGNFTFCALPRKSWLLSDYMSFSTYWEISYMDDPTTVIVAMRKIARVSDSEEMHKLFHSLMGE